MPSEHNKGRASQLIYDCPDTGTNSQYVEWLVKAVIFLITRYVKED